MSKASAFRRWLATPDPSNFEPLSAPSDCQLPLLVVGAGPAGLAGMAALKRAGLPFVGAERHGQVGGIWDCSNPDSSIYEGMRTVSSRFTSHLGTAMPGDWPKHVPHEQVFEYFKRFAAEEQLTEHLRLGTGFERAAKTPQGTWRVTLKRMSDSVEYDEEFRGIVLATGSCNKQQRTIPEKLRAQAAACGMDVIHSSEYKSADQFAGKRVLIVGIGNSGSDIGDKLSSAAARTVVAVRTSPWISPQSLLGVPCDKLESDTPRWFSKRYSFALFHVPRWLTVGGYKRLGLARPTHSMRDRLSITDRGIVRAIHTGRVVVRSNVTDLAGGIAKFADPQHEAEPFDAVIFATGFARSYPLLCEQGSKVNQIAESLAFLTFHRQEPALAYLAETVGLRGCWPVFVEQGRTIAAYFQAAADRRPNVARFDARRSLPSPSFKGELFHDADQFHVDYDIYVRALRDLAAWLTE